MAHLCLQIFHNHSLSLLFYVMQILATPCCKFSIFFSIMYYRWELQSYSIFSIFFQTFFQNLNQFFCLFFGEHNLVTFLTRKDINIVMLGVNCQFCLLIISILPLNVMICLCHTQTHLSFSNLSFSYFLFLQWILVLHPNLEDK